MPEEVFPVRWEDGRVIMIDQTRLPGEYIELCTKDPEKVAQWIETMVVRGAPAIGVAAGYGLALAAQELADKPRKDFDRGLLVARDRLARTRPTAVNLFWALERMMDLAESYPDLSSADLSTRLIEEAGSIQEEDYAMCRRMGELGSELLPDKGGVLTHCNAGALATAGYGTALGVIRAAWEKGKDIHVFADETRPRLQGARLTAWELSHLKIPFTLITDNMAGWFMHKGAIQAAVTGADRIASNGDTANKIGTYSVAVLCKEHGIPFYIAAPLSTVDFNCPDGDQIPIEERSRDEVLDLIPGGHVYEDINVANPAFDVTPNALIKAIITDRGIAYPPYIETLQKLREQG
jgi:methylthioribose-1-phosphate isomerase